MIGKSTFVVFEMTTALGVLGTTSAAWSSMIGGDRAKGGFVKPCSLDGVNPVHHPDIFGNPALARAYYGFVRARDGTWQVQNNCHIYCAAEAQSIPRQEPPPGLRSGTPGRFGRRRSPLARRGV